MLYSGFRTVGRGLLSYSVFKVFSGPPLEEYELEVCAFVYN